MIGLDVVVGSVVVVVGSVVLGASVVGGAVVDIGVGVAVSSPSSPDETI